MKFQKSLAARSALALVAAGSALALTACGAGQITQTSNQVPAVNGVFAQLKNISIRDATVVVSEDGNAYLKFTMGNIEERGGAVTLQSISVDGADAGLDGAKTIEAGCNLVASTPEEIATMETGSDNLCVTYSSPQLASTEGVFPGGSLPVTFTFDSGSKDVNVPVVGQSRPAGELYRDSAGRAISPEEFENEQEHEG